MVVPSSGEYCSKERWLAKLPLCWVTPRPGRTAPKNSELKTKRKQTNKNTPINAANCRREFKPKLTGVNLVAILSNLPPAGTVAAPEVVLCPLQGRHLSPPLQPAAWPSCATVCCCRALSHICIVHIQVQEPLSSFLLVKCQAHLGNPINNK